MTPGEWISLGTLAVVLANAGYDRNKKRFETLELVLSARIREIHDALTKRQDKQESDTEELRSLTNDLRTDVAVIKKTCRIMHNLPDSTDPSSPPHVSQIRRGIA